MKTFLPTLAVAVVLSQSAFAGNLSDPVIEEDVIVAETASSGGDILVPLMFLVFAAAVSTN